MWLSIYCSQTEAGVNLSKKQRVSMDRKEEVVLEMEGQVLGGRRVSLRISVEKFQTTLT
jgi:hypothetical protein